MQEIKLKYYNNNRLKHLLKLKCLLISRNIENVDRMNSLRSSFICNKASPFFLNKNFESSIFKIFKSFSNNICLFSIASQDAILKKLLKKYDIVIFYMKINKRLYSNLQIFKMMNLNFKYNLNLINLLTRNLLISLYRKLIKIM